MRKKYYSHNEQNWKRFTSRFGNDIDKGVIAVRECGILMHLTSLPGPYGVGTMGRYAFDFVDFLKQAGQSYWQIPLINPVLPLRATTI